MWFSDTLPMSRLPPFFPQLCFLVSFFVCKDTSLWGCADEIGVENEEKKIALVVKGSGRREISGKSLH